MATDEAPKDMSLFNDFTFSDIKIRQICNGKTKEYYSHRVILCRRSAYFRKALMGSFKEASADSMDIHDDNPDHFEAMLRYIYTEKFELALDASAFEMSFLFSIGVYILADKYDVEGLGEEAVQHFGCKEWRCLEGTCDRTPTPPDAVSMIQAYYETCNIADSKMGFRIAAFVLSHMKTFLRHPLFRNLILQYPMFATDILLSELFNDATFSDITIRQIYKGKVTEYAAHKAVLCTCSVWFTNALTGGFLEGSASTIDIRDDDPDVFRMMMEFFYDMELKIPAIPTTDQPRSDYFKDEVIPFIHLCALAEKYDARILQRSAAKAFTKSTAKWSWSLTAEDLEALVDAHYPYCTKTMCNMGEAIVMFLLKSPAGSSESKLDDKVTELVREYSEFGADLYLLGLRTGRLSLNPPWCKDHMKSNYHHQQLIPPFR
ncbi:hypothetical protein PTNB85_03775 [Pyrenophora teres f. teres]|nr:hypothetical protein HRS9139_05671 [Pyrenophora teres f. teres]KAE8840376.1 hypothetical protein PTNB85_03775 [Pyrenophora teres f. teres]KAE8863875.1 hypothetical protein PTNB29_03839 [Pyrenophora teres f. teres]